MNRKERLLATLNGKPVDRPAVNFYEVGGFAVDTKDSSPYNIYNSPSWKPLLDLAWEETDILRFSAPALIPKATTERASCIQTETWEENNSQFTKTTIKIAGRELTSLSRRDQAVDTVWTLEHLLKDEEDAKAYLQLPDDINKWEVDITPVLKDEEYLGDRGVVLLNSADPLCMVAPLFSMEDYTVIALTEPDLFHSLLKQAANSLYPALEAMVKACPGRLWRVCGPEYASEPYLPPRLFREYVYEYTKPVLDIIKSTGGFARLHSHGRLKNILDIIADMQPDGLDPIEPPNQGDIELFEVKKRIGENTVLFGNLEVSDIENMEPSEFEKVVSKAVKEGTEGKGRGFVLMPSASPYGREISSKTMANYQTMVRIVNS